MKSFWTSVDVQHLATLCEQWIPLPLRIVFRYTIEWPLRLLYFHGPSISAIGFWNGMSPEQICHVLTNSKLPHDFWYRSEEDCYAMVERQYWSFLVSVLCVVYFICLALLIKQRCY